MQELYERDLIRILSICQDYRQAYTKSEQALERIQEIAANGIGLWMCRFCKGVFNAKIPKQSNYFGEVCLSCAAKAELIRLLPKQN